jgi:hypothetical protein
MWKFQPVLLMHMMITAVLVKLVRRVESFKMGQRSVIKFCINLKKAATETFEMLRSAYGEECLSIKSVFES